MKTERTTFLAIFAVFFVEAAVLGNWIPRIPDVKASLVMSDTVLGLCLLAIPTGTVCGLLVAGRLMEHMGLRSACMLFLPLWALLFVLPALSTSALSLSAALFVCGVVVGLVDVAINTEANRIEQVTSRRIMSRSHGFWSLGSMAGALIAGAISHTGIGVPVHFLIVMPLLAIAGFIAAWMLPCPDSLKLPSHTAARSSLFRWPSRSILLLCFIPFGIMSVEGAFIDWSAVFMHSILDAAPLIIAVTYAFFSVVMAAARLSGDWLADRFGDVFIVRASGISAAIGIGLFAMAPNASIALLGATFAGLGVAIVYPLAVSAAARRPGNPVDNVASITMIGFTPFLLLPPMVGFLSDVIGLRWALFALVPLALMTAVFASELSRTESK